MTKVYLETTERFICPTCYSNPAKTGKGSKSKEKNPHYQIINNLSENLLSEDWTAHEELLLIESLQTRGFGNWTDIAEKVATKNKEECELHYMTVKFIPKIYLTLTKYWHPHAEDPEEMDFVTKKDGSGKARSIRKGQNSKKSAEKMLLTNTLVDDKMKEYEQKVKERKDMNSNQDKFEDILGFMPLRNDFDIEYDNEAELFLAEMEFNGKNITKNWTYFNSD